MQILSAPEIQKLPNIDELLDIIEGIRYDFEIQGGWESKITNIKDTAYYLGLSSSLAPYYNNAEPDDFIVSRLATKRFCFKPNLTNVPFLLRGQNKEYPYIISPFERKDSDDKLISRLKTEDFVSFVKTHPLCRMFDNGIQLPSFNKTLFFEMNYYGLAQHYNFHTGLIDFTVSPLVAAFFATTINKGNDTYAPIEDTNEYPYGVVYVHAIMPLTFKMFSTIGQQVFPRTGAQYGFFFQEQQYPPYYIGNHVYKFHFKHNAECSRRIFNLLDGGKRLFPKDDLCEMALEINNSKEVSLLSFAENLYTNPKDSLENNLERCRNKGVNINPNLFYIFTPELLQTYFQDIKNGLWEEFCRPIVFYAPEGDKLKDELLNLPNDKHYQQYFDQRYYERLYYHQLNLIRQHNKYFH